MSTTGIAPLLRDTLDHQDPAIRAVLDATPNVELWLECGRRLLADDETDLELADTLAAATHTLATIRATR